MKQTVASFLGPAQIRRDRTITPSDATARSAQRHLAAHNCTDTRRLRRQFVQCLGTGYRVGGPPNEWALQGIRIRRDRLRVE